MLKIPDICLVTGLACTVFTSFVMWLVYRWRLRVIRIRFNEKLAQQARIARELYDKLLQTVGAARLVADDASEKANDPTHMRSALGKLSSWLGQATLEGQQALKSFLTSTIEENDD